MDREPLSEKVIAISAKADQIATIAWIAASADFAPEKCQRILDDVLSGMLYLFLQATTKPLKISVAVSDYP